MLRGDHDVVDPVIVGAVRIACSGRVADDLITGANQMRQMLEVVAEQTHVASRERPSRRRDEGDLIVPKLHIEQLAEVVPIDRLENYLLIALLHDCTCRKMSRACSSLMRLTDGFR